MCKTIKFTVESENYTMGNVLEFFLKKNFNIFYCGYTMPHPLRELLVITIKTKCKINLILLVKNSCEEFKKIIFEILKAFGEETFKNTFN